MPHRPGSSEESLKRLLGTIKRQHSITLSRLSKLEEQLGSTPEPEPLLARVIRFFREDRRNAG